MAFSETKKVQYGFFHGLSKEAIEATQEPFESGFKAGHNTYSKEVLADVIQFCATEAEAITFATNYPSRVKHYDKFEMTPIPGTNQQAWYIQDTGKYVRPFIAPTDVMSPAGALSFGFDVKIFRSDDSFIPPTVGAWNVSPTSGLIIFQPGYTPADLGWGNIKISCFAYVGRTLQDVLQGIADGTTWQNPVLTRSVVDPATLTPNEGDRYLIPPTAVNAWFDHRDKIAQWVGGNWSYAAPEKGWVVKTLDEFIDYNYNGTSWIPQSFGESPQFEADFTTTDWIGTGPYTLIYDITDHNQGATKHLTAVVKKDIGASDNELVICDVNVTDNGLMTITSADFFDGSINIGKIGGTGSTDLINTKKDSFHLNFDTTLGTKEFKLVFPYNCVITSWYIVGDVAGDVSIDIWRDNEAVPIDDTFSICGDEKPHLTAQQFNKSTDFTNWELSLLAGDVLVFNIESAVTVSSLNFTLGIER